MSYDPLPAIREIREMVDVKHANDKLAVVALFDAERLLARDGNDYAARVRLAYAADTLRALSTSPDALVACELALAELRR